MVYTSKAAMYAIKSLCPLYSTSGLAHKHSSFSGLSFLLLLEKRNAQGTFLHAREDHLTTEKMASQRTNLL